MATASPIYRTDQQGLLVSIYTPSVPPVMLQRGETYEAPPAYSATDHEVAILGWTTGVWTVVPDYRGTVYYTAAGKKVTITTVNTIPPDDAIYTAPLYKYHTQWDNVNKKWIFDYTSCRADLYALIEEQKRLGAYNPLVIDGVAWDNDEWANIRAAQLHKVFSDNPDTVFENFYPNADVAIALNKEKYDIWGYVILAECNRVFSWRTTMRSMVEKDSNPERLMSYFDSIRYISTEYDAQGKPIEG